MLSWQTSMLHSELYFVYIQLFDVTSILLFFFNIYYLSCCTWLVLSLFSITRHPSPCWLTRHHSTWYLKKISTPPFVPCIPIELDVSVWLLQCKNERDFSHTFCLARADNAAPPDMTCHSIFKIFCSFLSFLSCIPIELSWMWVCDCCIVKMRDFFYLPLVLPGRLHRLLPGRSPLHQISFFCWIK